KLSSRKLTSSVSGSVVGQPATSTRGADCALKLNTGSPGGGITSSVFTAGSSLGTVYSKIARSKFARSLGLYAAGARLSTLTPGIERRLAPAAGVGLTKSTATGLTAEPVAEAVLSSAKPSEGSNCAR